MNDKEITAGAFCSFLSHEDYPGICLVEITNPEDGKVVQIQFDRARLAEFCGRVMQSIFKHEAEESDPFSNPIGH